MKNIEIDEELYQYIATSTQFIGESASSILRRLLSFKENEQNSKSSALNATSEKTEQKNQVVAAVTEEKIETVEKKEIVQPVQDIGSVFDYINKEELAMQRGAVGRFLLILGALHRVHLQSFSVVNEIRGRDRLYFAGSEAELAASGSSTKPRQIPDSQFWVITNSNTTRKKMMLTEAATALGYNDQQAEKIRELL